MRTGRPCVDGLEIDNVSHVGNVRPTRPPLEEEVEAVVAGEARDEPRLVQTSSEMLLKVLPGNGHGAIVADETLAFL